MAQRAPGAPAAAGPNATVVFWRYSIFWVLLLTLLFFIGLFGVVAEA